MRAAVALSLSAALWGCASASPGLPHPPVAPPPAGGEEAVAGQAPVEGVDFAVYRGDGTPSTLDAVMEAAGGVDVVFFGEQHDDLMTHRLQAEVLRRLFLRYQSPGDGPSPHASSAGASGGRLGGDRSVVLSLEMFERDVQEVVDEYLSDLITESHFLASARPWDFYEERYRPAVEFAKAHRLPVVAANAPRRYVNRASRLGRQSLADLPPSALAFLPPLPYFAGSEKYRGEWDALMGPAAAHMAGDPFDGQTLWDATMAWSVAQALEREPRALVLHFAGSFHVENFTGTPEALEHYRPGTRRLVVVGVPSDELASLPEEDRGLGDFVILTRGQPPATS